MEKNKALDESQALNEKLNEALFKQQQETLAALNKAREAEESAHAWYHNALILLPLGVLTGLLLGR